MKLLPPPALRAASASAAATILGLGGDRRAPTTCDESAFGAPEVLDVAIKNLHVKFLGVGNFTDIMNPAEAIEMPRATWTIEPVLDTNATSVLLSPPGLGRAVADGEFLTGIELDAAAIANAAEVGVVIRAPAGSLEWIEVSGGSPFKVNVARGFTELLNIYIDGGDTCSRGYNGCPTCDALYTSDELKGTGPTVVADLSSVNVVDVISEDINFTRSVSLNSYSTSAYDLTVLLPSLEDGAPVDLNFEPGNSRITIKGDVDCSYIEDEYSSGRFCQLYSKSLAGCEGCSNELVIDGKIKGYFNVSGEAPLAVRLSEVGGCDKIGNRTGGEVLEQIECTEGGVDVDAISSPCIGDAGVVECGSSPYDEYSEGGKQYYCLAPLPERYCPMEDYTSAGLAVLEIGSVFFWIPVMMALLW